MCIGYSKYNIQQQSLAPLALCLKIKQYPFIDESANEKQHTS